MFLPDGLGTNVPDNEHPSAVVPVKVPFAATISPKFHRRSVGLSE